MLGSMKKPRTQLSRSSLFRSRPAEDLFVQQSRESRLTSYVVNLAAMDGLVDFAAVSAAVDQACPRGDGSQGGRPPYPTETMVRIVFLQALYNLSDEAFEHQLLDRLSFQHFCRLDGALNVPDARTVWRFKQRLAAGALGGKAIFDSVSRQLQGRGYIARGGQIVDASIVQAPVAQVSSEERKALDAGETPKDFSAKQMAHTDRDARWTKKHGKSHYGYKLHSNVDARYKLIRKIRVTPANVDDGKTLKQVLDTPNTGSRLLADRGYDSQANRDLLRAFGLNDGIGRRAKVGQERKVRLNARNQTINRVRARVEHVFAGLSQLGRKVVRAMTLARNELAITLKCVVYNARRWAWLAANDPA